MNGEGDGSLTASAARAAAPMLAYATPAYVRPVVLLYRVAWLCWLVPLAVGVGCLALYAITRERDLPIIGMYTLIYGTAAFGIGLLCLIVFRCLLVRCGPDERQLWQRKSGLLVGLLVLNFPIGVACAVAGIALAKAFHG